MRERRAQGLGLVQIGRELDVDRDLLRQWALQVDAWGGAPRHHLNEEDRPTRMANTT
jgi:hypothetical protein